MITLAIPTYRRFDLLAECVQSAMAGSMPPDRVLIIDNSGGECPPVAGAQICMGRQPQSVAKAWNDACRMAARDYIILSNDDITFASDTIARMIAVAQQQPRAGVVSPIEGQRFSCFLIRWAAYLEIGGFDEGYTAAYFEDNHAARMLWTHGWELAVAPSRVQHVGSATLATYDAARMEQHHQDFRANEARYIRIWGGAPHHERYTEPQL